MKRTFTQFQIARLLRVNQQKYARWESGEQLPPINIQARIATILAVSRNVLWPGEEPWPEPDPVEEARA